MQKKDRKIYNDPVIRKLEREIYFLKQYGDSSRVGNMCIFLLKIKIAFCFFAQCLNFIGPLAMLDQFLDCFLNIVDDSSFDKCNVYGISISFGTYVGIAILISILLRLFNFYRIKESNIRPLCPNDYPEKYMVYICPDIYMIFFETVLYSYINYTYTSFSLFLVFALFLNLQLVLIKIFNMVTNSEFDGDRGIYFYEYDSGIDHLDDLVNYYMTNYDK